MTSCCSRSAPVAAANDVSGVNGGVRLKSGIAHRTNTLNLNAVKVVLLGESGVGKSSIAERYVSSTFNPENAVTIGAAFLHKPHTLKDGTKIKWNLWYEMQQCMQYGKRKENVVKRRRES
jgi:hypothetical protein